MVLGLAVVALTCGDELECRAQILSNKRGFADTGAGYNNLQATGAGWYYTWGTGVGNPDGFDAKHYPMIWGGTPSASTINNLRSRNPEYLLGFNEPERTDQANMTVAQAIASWTVISNGFASTSTKLVSPAVADTGGASGGQAWLASFMSQAAANNLRVDAVAFHWYGVSNPNDPAGAASSFLSRVQSYYNSYNKPVFITEFAIHDWGGAYTDAQIIEANRQFLNIVIPELESRSYVAGYSWYHWFSDAPLYSGNPPTPTEMGRTYVGALTQGKLENVAGRDLGQHVAYLAGGELTQTGVTPGTVRYINALAGSSTLSGTLDWGLTGTNWVRVQPGATLRKTGANQVTFGGTVTNNGGMEVAQGTLRLASSVAGAGKVVVKGGTLALTGAGRLTQASQVDVRPGATFDVSTMSSPYTLFSGRTLNADGTIVGDVVGTGGTFTGGGTYTGNFTANSGTLLRVGKDGAGVARRILIDNFESYGLGDVRTNASPPWTAHQDTSLADIENFGSKVLTYGFASDFRGTSRTMPDQTIIDNSETATLFFRINSKTDDPDHTVGLGDVASTGATNFGDFEAQLRLKQGTAAGTFAIDARNGGGFSATLASGLALNTWYNVWMVVNQSTGTYDLYMNTGTGAATAGNKLNASPLAFRNGTSSDLNTILALAGPSPVDNGVRLDDFTYHAGLDLTNSSAAFDPGLTWTPDTLTIEGDYTQLSGARLEFNLRDPTQHDELRVTGHVEVTAGVLNVTLAVGALAPQLGDVYDLLDFASARGWFETVNLPPLAAGLRWETTNLLTTGELAVVEPPLGDFNKDNVVDNFDLLAWQRGETPEPLSAGDFAQWLADFGRTTPPGTAVSAVPEPAMLALSAAVAIAVVSVRRRQPFASWPDA